MFVDLATLKLLGHAFDAAWDEIANDAGMDGVENRRTRLALIVIEIPKGGARDAESIKPTVVKVMRALDPW